MTSRRTNFAIALAVCSLLFLVACSENTTTKRPPAPPPPRLFATHNVLFSVSGGKCTQTIDPGTSGATTGAFVDVPTGDNVHFGVAPGFSHFTLTFVPPSAPCSSPFQTNGTCQLQFSDAAVMSGTSGVTFKYDSLTITDAGGTPTTCDLSDHGSTGPMGMRMRP